ncbi:protein lin-28 homolog [Clonorchis sinensis]|nr:protein lin-28 homolog [Clonorchis sinensis]
MFARYPWPEGQDFDSLRQSSAAPGPSTLVSPESSVSYRGRIKWFSSTRHFGFIIVDPSEEEIFFHQSNIRGILTPELTPNFPVSFMIRLTSKGPEAFNVRPYEEIHTFTYPHLSRTESRPQLAVPSTSMRRPLGVHPRRSVIRPTRRFRCYNCGQYASHKAAFCPMEPMRKCCYRCRSSTHLLADCPLPPASFLQPQRFVSQPTPFTTEAGISSEHRSPVLRKL